MRIAVMPLLLATAMGLSAAAYAADQPAPAMKGGGMMAGGMMRRQSMQSMMCMGLSDEHLAAVKAQLKLTDAQIPPWNAFVEAVKANTRAMRRRMAMMEGPGAGNGAQSNSRIMMMAASGPLPERLQQHEKMMAAHLDAIRRVRTALAPFYDALTPDQKAIADRNLCGQTGRDGP